MPRPTTRVRRNVVFRTLAKLSRQYLKWYHNASYKPHRNGERWVLERLRSESLRTVLDVGANVGTWARMASDILPGATIYALEIVPATFEELRANVQGDPRIRCFGTGLADREGRLSVRYEPTASAHATITELPRSWTGERLSCPVTTGDAFLRAQGLDGADYVKIDVEGAEHLVVQGFAETLARGRLRFVQFEYGQPNLLTKFFLKDFHDLFRGHGYAVGKIFPDHVDLRDYHLGDEDFLGGNYLACRADDPTRARLLPRG